MLPRISTGVPLEIPVGVLPSKSYASYSTISAGVPIWDPPSISIAVLPSCPVVFPLLIPVGVPLEISIGVPERITLVVPSIIL